MDISNFEIDAQLLEQFSSLGTDDKDDLIKAFKCVVGNNVTEECSRFFLELANWSLQKAIGAYYDYSFENSPSRDIAIDNSNNIMDQATQSDLAIPLLYDCRVCLSPNPDFKKQPSLVWCIQNNGTSVWPNGCYLSPEVNNNHAQFITHNMSAAIWLPIPLDFQIPVPEIFPGDIAHIVVDLQPPSDEVCLHALSNKTSIIGALRLCLPDKTRFGEILYCTAVPNTLSQTIVFKVGVIDFNDSKMTENSENHVQPMEDL